jgi:hypothetical protein
LPTRTPPSQLIRYRSLYHAWAGARSPARVIGLGGGGGVLWLVASGHNVWLETNRHPLAKLWRLDGIHAKPTLLGAYRRGSSQGGEFGAGAPTYAGNAAIGIYYVANPYTSTVSPTTQQVVRLSPGAPATRAVATVKAPSSQLYASSPPTVALGGSFYFLDPPTLSYPDGSGGPGVHGDGMLYRVTPKPAS